MFDRSKGNCPAGEDSGHGELLFELSVPRAILTVLTPLPFSTRALLIILAPASELENRAGRGGRARGLLEKNSGDFGESSARGPFQKLNGSSR